MREARKYLPWVGVVSSLPVANKRIGYIIFVNTLAIDFNRWYWFVNSPQKH